MKFLVDLGFDEIDIQKVESQSPEILLKEFREARELVSDNIIFLRDLGVINYKDVVINYTDMFLMDPSNFQNVFLKYEKDDLIEKIAKNVRVVEHL